MNRKSHLIKTPRVASFKIIFGLKNSSVHSTSWLDIACQSDSFNILIKTNISHQKAEKVWTLKKFSSHTTYEKRNPEEMTEKSKELTKNCQIFQEKDSNGHFWSGSNVCWNLQARNHHLKQRTAMKRKSCMIWSKTTKVKSLRNIFGLKNCMFLPPVCLSPLYFLN